jgi:hypothetical protein
MEAIESREPISTDSKNFQIKKNYIGLLGTKIYSPKENINYVYLHNTENFLLNRNISEFSITEIIARI